MTIDKENVVDVINVKDDVVNIPTEDVDTSTVDGTETETDIEDELNRDDFIIYRVEDEKYAELETDIMAAVDAKIDTIVQTKKTNFINAMNGITPELEIEVEPETVDVNVDKGDENTGE